MKIFLVLILLLIFIILVLEFFEMISNPYAFTLSFLVLTILMYFLVFKKRMDKEYKVESIGIV